MHIVLFNPEIPQNTGNIARTCASTHSTLHIIKPMGFSLSDKYLKRAGLDYWSLMDVFVYDDFEDLLKKYRKHQMYFASTKAPHHYGQVSYKEEDFIVFGSETKGLPESLLKKVYDNCIRIPMVKEARSLNLSNAVAIVLYESLRQQNFKGLEAQGHLTGREDPSAPWMDEI